MQMHWPLAAGRAGRKPKPAPGLQLALLAAWSTLSGLSVGTCCVSGAAKIANWAACISQISAIPALGHP
jgi:hypothetical protein